MASYTADLMLRLHFNFPEESSSPDEDHVVLENPWPKTHRR